MDDFSYLTPGHFLTDAPLTNILEPSLEFCAENRLSRWQSVQRMAETFWRRWSVEYIQLLQQRQKWVTKRPNVMLGDMVLVRQASLPPSRWLLGRVIKYYHGDDGLVRVVRVRTNTTEYDRPLSQLCLLPVKAEATSEK